MRTRSSTVPSGSAKEPSPTRRKGKKPVVKKGSERTNTESQTAVPSETPDGHYLIVRGRLWRKTNPNLSASDRERFVKLLMDARRGVKMALKASDQRGLKRAREQVQEAKEGLGERGPVWWDAEKEGGVWDRYLWKNTPYSSNSL
ncbi:hypothetical protein T439DRAFT_329113 [Meredithblackwellia eburnea MCA 4105]